MKQFFTLIFIVCFSILAKSQIGLNPNINEPILTNQMKQFEIQKAIANRLSRSTTVFDSKTPYVFNIKFYQINSDNSTNNLGYNFTIDDQIMDMVADLNTSFNQFNIFFKYRGFEIINNSKLSDFGFARQSITNSFEGLHDPDGTEISIVFCNVPYASAYIPNDPQTVVNKKTHTLIFRMTDWELTTIKNKTINKLFLGQNMGLLLGLFYINSEPNQAANGFFGDCGNVARDINYNWDIAGDYLYDTQATPQGFLGNGPNFGPFISGPCTADVTVYDGDCATPRALYINTLNDNYMDTTFPWWFIKTNDCYALNFTNNQGRRMRETIADSPTIYYGNFPLSNSLTSVSSLYQPYAQETILSTNMPPKVTDNGNGTATVCRYFYYSNYKFQKGFDYIFPDSTAPDVFTATTSQIPFVVHPMFNYPVTILQLAPGQTNLLTNTGFVLNNDKDTICVVEPFNNGTKSFTSQILSTSVTTESLNAVQIQDPNFYINLESQKLYKIIKETQSGAKTQELFFKQ